MSFTSPKRKIKSAEGNKALTPMTGVPSFFFICSWIPGGRGVARFMLAFGCQYQYVQVMCMYQFYVISAV